MRYKIHYDKCEDAKMVSGPDEEAKGGQPISLRVPVALRRQLQDAADKNRRKLSTEIIARLAASFGLSAPYEPAIASPQALEALELAKKNSLTIAAIRNAILGVCDDVYIDPLPEPATQLFIELARRLRATE